VIAQLSQVMGIDSFRSILGAGRIRAGRRFGARIAIDGWKSRRRTRRLLACRIASQKFIALSITE
jgi:hypothetical protein